MGRAHELMPIARDEAAYSWLAMSDEQRSLVDVEEHVVPLEFALDHALDPAGATSVRLVVYRPKGRRGPLPLLFTIHGGAFCILRADTTSGRDAEWACSLDCAVASVDYRLAPEHRFPAAIDDCYAAFRWAVANLEIDPDRVVVNGGSAGGALAAAVALMARDRGGPPIVLQALQIPVLDDRLITSSMQQFGSAPPGENWFDGCRSEGMWLHYLGEAYDRSSTSPYAAPARADDLTRLPRAFIQLHGRDPLRDEGLHYAQRLLEVGVPVELHLSPDLRHGPNPLDHPQVIDEGVALKNAFARAIRNT